MIKTYPKYKDSGAPWFGKVPSHWQTPRLGSVLRERKETNKANDVTKILSVMKDIGVIPYEEKGKIGNKCSEDITRYKIVRPGDIVANCMNIIIGSVGLSKYTGCLSPVYYVLTSRSQEDDSRFFDYVFKIKPFQLSLVRLGNGIMAHRMRIPMELLKCEAMPRPPIDEQKAIVEYLDVINKIIRSYVREKKKVIKFLNEQKQAIINRAVTGGMDPHVRLKASGIEWLGDIPESWRLFRVKQCSKKISKGTTPSTENREILSSGSIRFLKAENLSDGKITENPAFFIDKETNSILRRSQLEENDVLFVIAGATIGKSAVVRQENLPSNTNQAVAFIRPNNLVLANYLHLWLGSPRIKEMTWLNAVQSAQPNLSMADLGNFLMPLPSLDEQDYILKRLEESLKPIQVAIAYAHKQIEIISEYRNRLVLDVVTGKMDVRDIKLPEIEDINEKEPIDEQETLEDVEDIEEVVNADE